MGLFSRNKTVAPRAGPRAAADGSHDKAYLYRDPYSLLFRPEPVTFEPQAVASLPRRPYYYAPLSGGPPDTFLGHPTPVPTTSMGVTELATAPAAKVADPASQPKVPDSLGPPPGWWTRPFAPGPQKQNLPQSWLPAPISPALWPQPLTTATAWPPTVAFDVPAGADNQWASVDYLLPRETREGLGGEHRFAEQRKFSSTLRHALFDA